MTIIIVIIGLYCHAHDVQHGFVEAGYAHLAEFIVQYYDPIKKLSDEFSREHQRTIQQAVQSLIHVYHMKSAYVDKWKKTDFLSLVADKQLNLPSYSVFDMTTGELIPLESVELWIYFSYLLCYQAFSQSNEVTAMWKRVLNFNFTLTLFRDETVDVFKLAETTFEKVKVAKRIVKEMETQATSNAAGIHRERRRYLRAVLKEACVLFHDQPGLLGPKALLVFQLISYGRDEVVWLIKVCVTITAGRIIASASV